VKRLATVRTRLTVLYGGLFLVSTTVTMVIVNLLLQRVLTEKVATIGGTLPQKADPTTLPRGSVSITRSSGAVEVARDIRATVLAYQWGVTWAAVAILAVVALVAGWWLSGRVLRPLHSITETARRLSLSRLHERIDLQGPQDELKKLADTFDGMLARLERSVDGQRRFAANASHELRTPLAIQRAAIEIGLEDPSPDQLKRMREELLTSNQRMERLIEGLMILALGEQGLETVEEVRLHEVAAEVADQYTPQAAAAGITLRRSLHPCKVTGDRVLLARLTANLVSNAVHYNHPGGEILIETTPEGSLTVRNTGSHVPASSLPELFEPFRRLHAPRTGRADGAGLGLSIIAAITEVHNAPLTATPNPEGGLTITVRLPTQAP
jgi:signal transduction histidine kinase